jgi:predicted nuclease with TOPRIM domain
LNYQDMKNRIEEIEDKILWLKEEKKKLDTERQELCIQVREIERYKPIKVSDHALVRYCERKLDMDLETIREDIASYFIGGVDDGTYGPFIVKNNTIVTYIPG